MSQATRRWISEKVNSLSQSNALPFSEILDAEMVNAALAAAGVTFKERISTPFVTSACSSPRFWIRITHVVRRSHG